MHLLRLKSLTANCDFICVGVQDLHPQTVPGDLNNSFDIQRFDKARRLWLARSKVSAQPFHQGQRRPDAAPIHS